MNMRNLLLALLAMQLVACATPNMHTLHCRGLNPITSTTTLLEVQNHCLIKYEDTVDGEYVVKFINEADKKSIVCYFASNTPTAVVNGCRH